jgi:phosphoglycerate dehydrogenase-like enzyme
MLGELLKESDVVTLHVPLTAATQHRIGGVELRMMKPTAILINTSRGSIVDERALCEALINGWIAGAGLDVLEVEPPSPDSPLLAMENVVMTPHVGGSSIQRVKRSTEFALANVKRVLKGLPPLGLVTAA